MLYSDYDDDGIVLSLSLSLLVTVCVTVDEAM